VVISAVEEKNGGKLVTTEYVEMGGKRRPAQVRLVSADGVFLVAENGRKYDEPWCILKLPYREGQKWETRLRGRGFEADGTMRTGPIETVRVPVGEVSAVRIEWEFTIGQNRHTATHWYAHGIGLVRVNETLKLKSFTLGKD
jgi:hypothetical protein